MLRDIVEPFIEIGYEILDTIFEFDEWGEWYMSMSVDLYKINYKKFVDKLMENPKINDRELLEKIILEFGNKVGKDLIILENEFYEDGICTWNMFAMITEVFELEEDDYVDIVFFKLQKGLIGYKEIDDAYDNLGLERSR